MVKFNKELYEKLLCESNKIRNISIIAHVDHGKSTLTDQLAVAAGFLDEESAGEKRVCDIDKNEIEKGITIKSTSLSMVLENPDQQNDHYLVNLIDCPGHIDFNSEVTTALRVTDGAVLVVDAVEGCRGQTETVIRQALQEKIKPVLMINKVDRLIEELQYSTEESYQNFVRIIESVNALLSTYDDNFQVDPLDGNVCFGSGKMGWGFTLPQFAQMISKKFNLPPDKILKKLWGEYYFDSSTNKIVSEPYNKNGEKLRHTFCEFVLEPIFKIFKECKASSYSESLDKIVSSLSINISSEDKKKEPKGLLKTIMRKFIPAHKGLVQMVINHLPSPSEAQKYRYEMLYTGEDLTDQYAQGIKNCDPNGPLVVYVSKMIPMHSNLSSNTNNVGRFIALARVFSGSLTQSTRVRILGPGYSPSNQKKDVYLTNIQRLVLLLGKSTESVSGSVAAGSVIGIIGLDKYVIKTCTCTEENNIDCLPIKGMKYSVSPVVQLGVEPENPADLTKFIEGIKRLIQSDPLLECKTNDAGQHVLGAAGELHLEICLKNLQEEYAKGISIKKSPPVVTFHESVSLRMNDMVMAKSPNKLNKLFMSCEPLHEEIVELMENGLFKPEDKKCLDLLDWDSSIAKKIWCFGPESGTVTNILLNSTKSVEYVNEIKQHVMSSFHQTTMGGGLCNEVMRGVLFKLEDAQLHTDAVHRGSGHIIQATNKVMLSSQLKADPRLVEPIYRVEVQCPQSVIGSVYSALSNRRCEIKSTDMISGTPLMSIVGNLPVLESFGLTEELRSLTQGQASPQCTFSHWKMIDEDVYDEKSSCNKIIKAIRKRKGMKEEIPLYTEYCDSMSHK